MMGDRWWLLLFALLFVAAGCAAGVQLARDQVRLPGQLLFNGHVKPEVDCYRCHGGDGRGSGRGPGLAERIPAASDSAILKVIREGDWPMPGYQGKLTEQEEQELLAWLRAEFPETTPAAP